MTSVDINTQDVFLSLIRSAFWSTPVEIPAGFSDWAAIARLARSQSVLGVVGDEMVALDIPKELKAKVKTYVMRTVMTHGKVNAVLTEVVSKLREKEVCSVLLKGQGIARYYPKPELRQCGDIDLYVGVENYAISRDILQESATKIDEPKALKVGKHYHAEFGNVEVEMHRFTEIYPSRKYNSVYQAASDAGMSSGLVPMSFSGVEIMTPSDDFNAFFIFSHLFHHFLTSGIGLRQFCDWMMLLHSRKDYIDKDNLGKILTDMDMMGPWQSFGCVLVEHLGLPQDEFPFYDRTRNVKVDGILSRVLSEGNFGQERDVNAKRGKLYILNKIRSLWGHVLRTSQLLRIFPSQAFRQFFHTLSSGVAKVFNDL